MANYDFFSSPEEELKQYNWYLGEISREKACDYLKNREIGGFLVRKSSQPGCYAISFVNESNEVKHQLVYYLDKKGWSFQGKSKEEEPTFSSMAALLDNSAPLTRLRALGEKQIQHMGLIRNNNRISSLGGYEPDDRSLAARLPNQDSLGYA